jgi:hypothetical protein
MYKAKNRKRFLESELYVCVKASSVITWDKSVRIYTRAAVYIIAITKVQLEVYFIFYFISLFLKLS